MKGRVFWLVLFLIGLSWMVNSYYAYSKRLDEPIFLDHYIEQSVDESGGYLKLYYLTNINDTSHVSYVNFDGITGYVAQTGFFDEFFDDFDFSFNDNEDTPNLQTFTHYALREILVQLNSSEMEEVLKEDGQFIIHNAELSFSDGRDVTVPIGEVILLPPYPLENVLTQWGSSSGDNWNILTYRAEEALTIDIITWNFSDVLQDKFLVKFDSTNTVAIRDQTHEDLASDNWRDVPGIDIQDLKFPHELKKDEYFTIYTQTSPDFVGMLESSLVITGKTESDKPYTSYSLFYSQQPYLKQKDVDRLIQERGVSK